MTPEDVDSDIHMISLCVLDMAFLYISAVSDGTNCQAV